MSTEVISANEIMTFLNLSHKHTFRQNYLSPALKLRLVEMTLPEKPNSRFQKYKLTDIGIQLKKMLADGQ
jgi:ATP-dependent DNA helicase RecG